MSRFRTANQSAPIAATIGVVFAAALLASLATPAFGAGGVPQFLTLPFDASNKKIVLQRAWTTVDPNTGKFTLNHHAIDYVNGTRDVPGTWKTFDVLAAAAGEACGARTGQVGCYNKVGEIMGNRVLIKHEVEGKTYYTFYNHLASIPKKIPLNNIKDTAHVDAGEVIGEAGDSNSPGVLHLHLELLDENFKPIDPYGIYGITDQYPDPRGKNGKDAGKKNYFLTDPPQPFNFVPKPTKAPPTDPVSTGEPVSSDVPSVSPSHDAGSPSPSAAVTSSPSASASQPPAVSTLPPSQPPASSDSGPNLVPIVLGVGGVVLVGVILGIYGLSRRPRNPLPPDRWRPR